MRCMLATAFAVALATTSAIFGASPARAGDDLGQRITISVAPVYLFASNGDANAPPPPGSAGIGYTKDHPIADSVRVDYGVDLKLSAKTHLSFSHGNVAYQLGRILTLAPNTSLVTGAINDYTDTIALSYAVGHGIGAHVTYFNHQRSGVTGLCLNQKSCAGPNGTKIANPLSIDERGYTVGGTYDFGPKTAIGPLFQAGADLKYVPRSSTPRSPNVALGGLGAYKGSQVMVPYSLTARLAYFDPTFIPFVNYTVLPVLYHDSAVPEFYKGAVFGVIKVLSKNVTFSYTNLNLQSCRCVPRVPPPDNLRLALGIVKLDYHTHL